ncbi:MAG: hypothetical protein WBH28_24700 [Fuerstiella sp.]
MITKNGSGWESKDYTLPNENADELAKPKQGPSKSPSIDRHEQLRDLLRNWGFSLEQLDMIRDGLQQCGLEVVAVEPVSG